MSGVQATETPNKQLKTSKIDTWVDFVVEQPKRRPFFTYKILIIAGVILGSILIGYASTRTVLNNMLPLMLIAGILGVGVAVFFLIKPDIGYILLASTGLLVPLSIGTGTQTSFNATFLLSVLLVGLWLYRALASKRLALLNSLPVLPAFIFALVCVIAFGFGLLPWFYQEPAPLRAQIGGLALFLVSIGIFLAIGHQVARTVTLRHMTFLFISVGSVYVLTQFSASVSNIAGRFFQDSAAGSMFWMWLIGLAISQSIFNKSLHFLYRILLLAIVGLTLFVCIFLKRDWLSGWLPSLVTLIVILLIRWPRLTLLSTLVGGTIMALNQDFSTTLLLSGDNLYSLTTRLAAWTVLIGVVEVNPFFGLGFANYYYFDALFPILGYYVRFNSHNNYYDIVAQTGLIGLFCFVWLLYSIFRLAWKLLQKAPEGFEKAYVVGTIGGIAGIAASAMLGDWLLPFVYNIGYEGFRASALAWIFLGGLLVIEKNCKKSEAKPQNLDVR